MSELTLVLERVNAGDSEAFGELTALVYDELRRRARFYTARQGPAHTLQATALVHEAFAKMAGASSLGWQDKRHFFNAAAEVMRQIVMDRARRRNAQKRGGGRVHEELVDVPDDGLDHEMNWEGLDAALQRLKELDDRRYQTVMLRYFAGLNDQQIAQSLGVSDKTVQRDWKLAKAFLRSFLEP